MVLAVEQLFTRAIQQNRQRQPGVYSESGMEVYYCCCGLLCSVRLRRGGTRLEYSFWPSCRTARCILENSGLCSSASLICVPDAAVPGMTLPNHKELHETHKKMRSILACSSPARYVVTTGQATVFSAACCFFFGSELLLWRSAPLISLVAVKFPGHPRRVPFSLTDISRWA